MLVGENYLVEDFNWYIGVMDLSCRSLHAKKKCFSIFLKKRRKNYDFVHWFALFLFSIVLSFVLRFSLFFPLVISLFLSLYPFIIPILVFSLFFPLFHPEPRVRWSRPHTIILFIRFSWNNLHLRLVRIILRTYFELTASANIYGYWNSTKYNTSRRFIYWFHILLGFGIERLFMTWTVGTTVKRIACGCHM